MGAARLAEVAEGWAGVSDLSQFVIRSYDDRSATDDLGAVAHVWGWTPGFQGKRRFELLPATAFGQTRGDAENKLRAFLLTEIARAEAVERNARAAAERMRARHAERKVSRP